MSKPAKAPPARRAVRIVFKDDDGTTLKIPMRDVIRQQREQAQKMIAAPSLRLNRAGKKLRDKLDDDAALGKMFSAGRKPGTVSLLRLAVRRILKRRPMATAAEVWSALKARPPQGIALYESPRLGRYIETDGQRDTSYRAFQNIVSRERPK